MKKRVLMMVTLLMIGGASQLPVQAATAVVQPTVDQEAFWLGVRTGQGDVAYFQQAVNDGSMTWDAYQETIQQMRAIALERTYDPAYSQSEQDYYRGYYEGLAFA